MQIHRFMNVIKKSANSILPLNIYRIKYFSHLQISSKCIKILSLFITMRPIRPFHFSSFSLINHLLIIYRLIYISHFE